MIRRRPPFWLSALNYYILVIAIAAALFFVLWGILNDSGEKVPWVGAGLAACIVIAGAVFVREFILRISHGRHAAEKRRMDVLLHGLPSRQHTAERKLTIERNSALLQEIRRKSEAAKILDRLPEGHREVFEMCGRYLAINSKELATVSPGSPRLAALLKAKDAVEGYHKFHLLKWAEIESRHYSAEAKRETRIGSKLESAHKALGAITSALQFYPNDDDLQQSEQAVLEFIATIKLGNLIERAERATFKGNHRHAKRLYREALFFLERNGQQMQNREEIAERISGELVRIEQLPGEPAKGPGLPKQ